MRVLAKIGPVVGRRLWVFGFMLASVLRAADLKPETLSAWERYIQSADTAMQARLRPGHAFLWTDEVAGRRRRTRAGEILVASVGEHTPKKVPSGLIHHWIGAAFFPNTRLGDVLSVVRDYAHYKDYYNPTVIHCQTIRQGPDADRFSMLLTSKSFFLKTALDSEYISSFTQAGPNRWYELATAVRVQEVDDYGQAGERELPPDEGSGYVWRLHSIARFEEADGGVYVELEAMALSRDIPGAVRWVVDPIVRRVSRSAMVTSLRQTLDAVNVSREVVAERRAAKPDFASGFMKSPPRY